MATYYETYIEKYLIPQITAHFENEELISFKAENSGGLDGFMSVLFNIHLKTQTNDGVKKRMLIAKFMRGDVAFRESSKSYIQFANEIYIYGTVLPCFNKFLQAMNVSQINVMDLVPTTYVAKFGYIKGLSASPNEREAALVLENLKPLGYKLGPRLVLNKDHLTAMCKILGQYHSISYGLRALNNSQLERLKSGIIPLPFINDSDPNDSSSNLYRVLYRYAFDRFFAFFDRKIETNTFDKKSGKDLKFIENLRRIREKYFEEPTRLLESLRTKIDNNEEDKYFGAILHGDYNRNNVLFKYKLNSEKGAEEELVEDVKMIDFQELRYGSLCLDLSFFMYFNSSENERYEIWEDLLKAYHNSMYSSLSIILNASKKSKQDIADILHNYSFEKFLSHFSRFAFYGCMICLHFLPWMLCGEEECSRLSELFGSDLHGEEFRKLSVEAGGDDVNMRMLKVLRHASAMGYMDDL